ncbi:hypothetical protein JCM8097_003390 [Rhodosporidiobolus ruineniae]
MATPSDSPAVPSESPAPPAPSGSLPPFPPSAVPPPDLDSILRAATVSGVPAGHGRAVLRSPRPSLEKYDERCWIRSKQTNARRALGREPQVTMYCYLNFRNALSDLVPVPGSINAFLARDAAPGSPDEQHAHHAAAVQGKGKGKAVEGAEDLPAYRWPFLDGRYLYIARGREAVARHMKEMGGVAVDSSPVGEPHGPRLMRKSGEEEKAGAWDTIARIEERCEKLEAQNMLPGKREERLLKKAMGLDEDDSERLISLSTAYYSSLQRLHAHVLRIYTPAFKQLARLPSTFTDGTQLQMLQTLGTRFTDGSAFNLAGRLYESFWNVQKQLEERRRRASGGGDGGVGGMGGFGGLGGGFGGNQPPVPPAPPRDASPRAGEASSGGPGQGGGEGPVPPVPPVA